MTVSVMKRRTVERRTTMTQTMTWRSWLNSQGTVDSTGTEAPAKKTKIILTVGRGGRGIF
jgi:hypothetical protein